MLELSPSRRLPLRDPADANELRTNQRMATRISSGRYRRGHFVERPARRFTPARHALQEHPLLLEVQQVVVAVQPAEHLTDSIDHAKPVHVRLIAGRPDPLV